MEEDSEYTLTEEVSLKEVLASGEFRLPLIVRTCGRQEARSRSQDACSKLPEDTILLLEKQTEVSYARLKVLQLESEKKTQSEMGPEFVIEYGGFVGREILVPGSFPLTMKMIHPPGRSRRYAKVLQIIEDMPRFVRFETDTASTSQHGQKRHHAVSRGTVMEVTGVVDWQYEIPQYLECTALTGNKDKHYFHHEQLVNCTAVADDTSYTLASALTSALPPKVFRYDRETTPDDAAATSSNVMNDVLVMTYGPVQLLGSEQRRVAVGWHREKNPEPNLFHKSDKPHYTLTLIPEGSWDKEMVRVCRFNVPGGQNVFMENTFLNCQNSRVVDEKLYIMPENEALVTWLTSEVELPEERPQPTEDQSDDLYTIPAPPLPPRERRSNVVQEETDQEKVRKDRQVKVGQKVKLGFGHVHKQLSLLFKNKDKPKPVKKRTSKDTPPPTPEQKPDRPFVAKRQSSKDRPLPDIPRERDEPDGQENVDQARQCPLISESKPRASSQTVVPSELTMNVDKFESQTHSVGDIMKKNQTVDDFRKYTVGQVAECFRVCALETFANISAEHNLDGEFLANFELDELKLEPFHLSTFQVKKVKLVIYNGWRPN